MPTQQQAIDYAKTFGWTEADAKRAFANVELTHADELTLLTAMVNFAGPNLYERQRLQGAQKGLVTKKAKYIKTIEQEFAQKVSKYQEELAEQRSFFVTLIAQMYQVANRFGFQDAWVEVLLEQYDEHQKRA